MSAVEATEWIEVTQKIKIIRPPSVENLIYEDGIPMESDWHRAAMNLLIEIISFLWRQRQDFYVGGNMFIYFDPDQVKKRNFRGPDFFVVKGNIVEPTRWRDAWVLWEEGGLAPNLIIELSSPSTEVEDIGSKKEIYEQILRVPEYICYHPKTEQLLGWCWQAGHYSQIQPDERGWLWSNELELWIGTWWGEYLGRPGRWLRFFNQAGHLVLTEREAEIEAHHAAEAEIARLKAQLKQLGQSED